MQQLLSVSSETVYPQIGLAVHPEPVLVDQWDQLFWLVLGICMFSYRTTGPEWGFRLADESLKNSFWRCPIALHVLLSDRHLVSTYWARGLIAHSPLVPTFSSSNNRSAFNKRKTIIKIVIIKKVFYIIHFLLVYYSGIFCTWPRTKFPMYIETWGKSIDLGSLSLMPWKTRFLSSFENVSPLYCSEVATFCKPGGSGRGLGPGERGHFLLSPPTVCVFTKAVSSCCFWIHHSPWWKAWWGWWGRGHCGPACCSAPSPASARSSVGCWPNPATRSSFPATHQLGLYSGHVQETPW